MSIPTLKDGFVIFPLMSYTIHCLPPFYGWVYWISIYGCVISKTFIHFKTLSTFLVFITLKLKSIHFQQYSNYLHFKIFFRPSSYFHKFTEAKLFILYSIYSFGLPGLLTILMHILDSTESVPYHLKPGFGVESCFIKGIFFVFRFDLPMNDFNISRRKNFDVFIFPSTTCHDNYLQYRIIHHDCNENIPSKYKQHLQCTSGKVS